MSISDYTNGTAPRAEMVFFENMWLDPARVPEIAFVKAYCEARGVSFRGTQGYRWLGVYPDDYRLGQSRADEDSTSDGTANQWYVKGVESVGGASAATPGSSNHGRGLSVDVSSDGPDWQAVRDEAFRLVGWDRDVIGETWHYTKKRAALVDLSEFAVEKITPIQPKDPFEEENDMYVWTNQDVNRSYTVSRGTAKHHSNNSEKAIALKSIGGNDREIKLTDFEFATALVNAGMSLFVDPDFKLTRFNDPAWNGREVAAPSVDGGTFLAEWDRHYGIKR